MQRQLVRQLALVACVCVLLLASAGDLFAQGGAPAPHLSGSEIQRIEIRKSFQMCQAGVSDGPYAEHVRAAAPAIPPESSNSS